MADKENLRVPGLERTVRVTFMFNGETVQGYKNESIAAALLASGRSAIRRSIAKTARGYYCGMGICWECVVNIEGRGHVRACLEPVAEDLVVTSVEAGDHE